MRAGIVGEREVGMGEEGGAVRGSAAYYNNLIRRRRATSEAPEGGSVELTNQLFRELRSRKLGLPSPHNVAFPCPLCLFRGAEPTGVVEYVSVNLNHAILLCSNRKCQYVASHVPVELQRLETRGVLGRQRAWPPPSPGLPSAASTADEARSLQTPVRPPKAPSDSPQIGGSMAPAEPPTPTPLMAQTSRETLLSPGPQGDFLPTDLSFDEDEEEPDTPTKSPLGSPTALPRKISHRSPVRAPSSPRVARVDTASAPNPVSADPGTSIVTLIRNSSPPKRKPTAPVAAPTAKISPQRKPLASMSVFPSKAAKAARIAVEKAPQSTAEDKQSKGSGSPDRSDNGIPKTHSAAFLEAMLAIDPASKVAIQSPPQQMTAPQSSPLHHSAIPTSSSTDIRRPSESKPSSSTVDQSSQPSKVKADSVIKACENEEKALQKKQTAEEKPIEPPKDEPNTSTATAQPSLEPELPNSSSQAPVAASNTVSNQAPTRLSGQPSVSKEPAEKRKGMTAEAIRQLHRSGRSLKKPTPRPVRPSAPMSQEKAAAFSELLNRVRSDGLRNNRGTAPTARGRPPVAAVRRIATIRLPSRPPAAFVPPVAQSLSGQPRPPGPASGSGMGGRLAGAGAVSPATSSSSTYSEPPASSNTPVKVDVKAMIMHRIKEKKQALAMKRATAAPASQPPPALDHHVPQHQPFLNAHDVNASYGASNVDESAEMADLSFALEEALFDSAHMGEHSLFSL